MYFITCFQKYEKVNGWPEIGAARTFGYYSYRDWAIDALHNNSTDLHEMLYDYAVVEKIPGGLSQLAEEKIFLKWDEERQGFFEVDGADFEDCFGNYAFG